MRRKVKTGVAGTGAMSDQYNPLEERLLLTRNSMELINAYGFGTALATKSDMIVRDADVLKDIQSQSPVIVRFSVSVADDGLCGKIEPNVATTSKRFEAMAALTAQGIYCGVLMIPMLPFIGDNEANIVQICKMAKEAGASFVCTHMGMTLMI